MFTEHATIFYVRINLCPVKLIPAARYDAISRYTNRKKSGFSECVIGTCSLEMENLVPLSTRFSTRSNPLYPIPQGKTPLYPTRTGRVKIRDRGSCGPLASFSWICKLCNSTTVLGLYDNLKTRSNDLRILGVRKQIAPDPAYLFSYLLQSHCHLFSTVGL